MEETAAVRGAALDALADIDPAPLRDCLRRSVSRGSMVPGVLTIFTARALSDGASGIVVSDETLQEPVAKRAAGVQLIYDGLDLTRELAHSEPWIRGETGNADLLILAADVLVSRGFHLLARTEASDAAVATVRAFGCDQTIREEMNDASLDRNLERDVLELSIVAGASMTERNSTPQLREFVAGLVSDPPFPSAESFFPEKVVDSLSTMATEAAGSEGVTTSADH